LDSKKARRKHNCPLPLNFNTSKLGGHTAIPHLLFSIIKAGRGHDHPSLVFWMVGKPEGSITALSLSIPTL
jgi:hypothetical protein